MTLRKLELIHAAKGIEDPRVPPGNRLEQLVGDRRGQHSIRVNSQWRICSCGEMEERKTSNSSTATEVDLMALSIGVPPRRINEIVHGKRGITADPAIRLARYFGTSDEF